MSHTFSTMWFHIVFAAKDRKPLIHEEWKNDLYHFMGGIIRRCGASMIEINGIEDHVHMLINSKPNLRIDYLIRGVKSESSLWLHKERISHTFQWQRGYAAFSVSESVIPKITRYILNQQEHHQKQRFEDEFIMLLNMHNIQYDEKYLWK